MQTKIIITGGKGDIAQALRKKLVDNYENYDVFMPSHNKMDVTNLIGVVRYMTLIKPDILINNAGYINPSSIKNGDVNDWKQHIDVNLIGLYLCTRTAINFGCKTVINIGSSAGTKAKPDWSAYCASKRAVVSFTESLVAEGIDSICISPGRTDTKMRRSLFPGEDKKDLLTPDEFADKAIWIMDKLDVFKGMDLVVKKELGEINIFYFKKVKKYV